MTTYARYLAHGDVAYGVVEGDTVHELTAAPYEEHEVTDHTHGLDDVKLLAPVVPGKVVAIGLNYRSHLGDRTPPSVPEPFFKTTSSVIGPGDDIIIPREAIEENVTMQPEAELALVVGKKSRRVSAADALDHILGFTCGNDVSARDWQANDLSWWRAKSSDTFTPLGPVIVTGLDPSSLHLVGRINGKVDQEQMTSDLLYGVPEIFEFRHQGAHAEPRRRNHDRHPGHSGRHPRWRRGGGRDRRHRHADQHGQERILETLKRPSRACEQDARDG